MEKQIIAKTPTGYISQAENEPKECIHCSRIPNHFLEDPATENRLKREIAGYLREPGRIRENEVEDILWKTVYTALENHDGIFAPEDCRQIVMEVADIVKLLNFFDRHFYNIFPEFIHNNH